MADDTNDAGDEGDVAEGTDSRVTEWFGQSVASDTELGEQLSEDHDPETAEKLFKEQSRGADVEERRRGDSIDPEFGERAYREDDPGHAADAD